MSTPHRTWLITGTSTGFGAELVKQIILRGDKVIATARNASSIAHPPHPNLHKLKLDVTAPLPVLHELAKETWSVFGNIDVLINNAGYISIGALEEVTPEETQNSFNVNVLGPLNVTRAFLPYFRAQKSGIIAFMGTIGGWRGIGAMGLYCSSKFALAGAVESLRLEVKPFGIDTFVIEPGYFRTSFLSPEHERATHAPPGAMKAYDDLREPVRDRLIAVNGRQPGNPVEGVKRIIEVITGEGLTKGKKVPSRLLLGSDCYDVVSEVLEREQNELKEWKEFCLSTDFPKGQ